MLTIIYGDVPNSIYNTNVYFKNTYESEWFESDLAQKMIKDVDHSDVEDSHSGYEFFHALAEQKQITCITANGKSNIMKLIFWD